MKTYMVTDFSMIVNSAENVEGPWRTVISCITEHRFEGIDVVAVVTQSTEYKVAVGLAVMTEPA